MASLTQDPDSGLRIAVEGCGHGTLHEIYASVRKASELKGWPDVDLLIIGGDFQALRNAHDLSAISMPKKYHAMKDFHEYYSGTRTAPYLTIFIGGNHEASNYMWELYYGGWVAPKIYYMGAANVIRLGPLRIAGLSGIWKGYNYRKPHYERLPYNDDDVRSIYHVRELDVRKLLQLRSQVDIGLSHDWPKGMEWKGDHAQLFRFKQGFEQDAKNGQLGSVAATTVLDRLRPMHWFSAHMHARFTAVWEHDDKTDPLTSEYKEAAVPPIINADEVDLNIDDTPVISAPRNEAEIDLDLEEETEQSASMSQQVQTTDDTVRDKPADIRDLLPESFARPSAASNLASPPTLPFPHEITNKTTKFLALDKCLPGRHFLQLLEVTPRLPVKLQRPLQLEYDQEWLAITRVFASDLQVGNPAAQVPQDKGDVYYRPLIEKEMAWVHENIVKQGKMEIPSDFAKTAPVYDASMGINVTEGPEEYSNPHTQNFCDLLQIPNHFHATDEERAHAVHAELETEGAVKVAAEANFNKMVGDADADAVGGEANKRGPVQGVAGARRRIERYRE